MKDCPKCGCNLKEEKKHSKKENLKKMLKQSEVAMKKFTLNLEKYIEEA